MTIPWEAIQVVAGTGAGRQRAVLLAGRLLVALTRRPAQRCGSGRQPSSPPSWRSHWRWFQDGSRYPCPVTRWPLGTAGTLAPGAVVGPGADPRPPGDMAARSRVGTGTGQGRDLKEAPGASL